MKSISRSPHYLVRNPHSYCFRVNVPKDLQQLVGRRELRYSLKTGAVGVAIGRGYMPWKKRLEQDKGSAKEKSMPDMCLFSHNKFSATVKLQLEL